jgi:hypothetical protein
VTRLSRHEPKTRRLRAGNKKGETDVPLFCASELILGRGYNHRSVEKAGKEDCPDRGCPKALGTIFHMMKEEIDYEEFVRRGSNAQ